MKLNRVKMFARKISATDRLVRSPPAFASPRERSSATWALVRPAAGVSAITAPGAGGVEATASAMPGHRTAVKGQRNARPSRGRRSATSTASLPPAPRLTVPQTPSVRVAPAPIPVHTAYAGPTSRFRSAKVSSPKLTSAHAAKPAVGQTRVIPWLCFSSTAKPVSKIPATSTSSQAIALPPACGQAHGYEDERGSQQAGHDATDQQPGRQPRQRRGEDSHVRAGSDARRPVRVHHRHHPVAGARRPAQRLAPCSLRLRGPVKGGARRRGRRDPQVLRDVLITEGGHGQVADAGEVPRDIGG